MASAESLSGACSNWRARARSIRTVNLSVVRVTLVCGCPTPALTPPAQARAVQLAASPVRASVPSRGALAAPRPSPLLECVSAALRRPSARVEPRGGGSAGARVLPSAQRPLPPPGFALANPPPLLPRAYRRAGRGERALFGLLGSGTDER